MVPVCGKCTRAKAVPVPAIAPGYRHQHQQSSQQINLEQVLLQ